METRDYMAALEVVTDINRHSTARQDTSVDIADIDISQVDINIIGTVIAISAVDTDTTFAVDKIISGAVTDTSEAGKYIHAMDIREEVIRGEAIKAGIIIDVHYT